MFLKFSARSNQSKTLVWSNFCKQWILKNSQQIANKDWHKCRDNIARNIEDFQIGNWLSSSWNSDNSIPLEHIKIIWWLTDVINVFCFCSLVDIPTHGFNSSFQKQLYKFPSSWLSFFSHLTEWYFIKFDIKLMTSIISNMRQC